MPLPIQQADTVLQAAPSTHSLGIRLIFCGDGIAELGLCITEKVRKKRICILRLSAYAVDNALASTAGGALGAAILTSEFKINCVRPMTRSGFIARAVFIHARRAQAAYRYHILTTVK